MFVITGGGSGIGRALALNLANRGNDILIIGRNIAKLQDVCLQNSQIKYFVADVATTEGRSAVGNHLNNKSIQGLINNAGVIQPIVSMLDMNLSEWHKCMATNLEAPLFLTQILRDNLIGGRVLNIGSGAAHFAVAGWSAYCVSKAALYRLTDCWRHEVDDIYFASVQPGIIDTPMQAEIRAAGNMNADKKEFFESLYKEQKLVSPDVVASFLSWLMLDVNADIYSKKEWDIYDSSHHSQWLSKGQVVPDFE